MISRHPLINLSHSLVTLFSELLSLFEIDIVDPCDSWRGLQEIVLALFLVTIWLRFVFRIFHFWNKRLRLHFRSLFCHLSWLQIGQIQSETNLVLDFCRMDEICSDSSFLIFSFSSSDTLFTKPPDEASCETWVGNGDNNTDLSHKTTNQPRDNTEDTILPYYRRYSYWIYLIKELRSTKSSWDFDNWLQIEIVGPHDVHLQISGVRGHELGGVEFEFISIKRSQFSKTIETLKLRITANRFNELCLWPTVLQRYFRTELDFWVRYTNNIQTAERSIMHYMWIPAIINSEIDICDMDNWMSVCGPTRPGLHVHISKRVVFKDI